MFSEFEFKNEAQLKNCLRDVVALSTLPAVWLGADGLRLAENVAASLYTAVQPEFLFVLLSGESGAPPVCVAQTGRYETSAALAKRLQEVLPDWARGHDPDELLEVPGREENTTVRVTVRPLGFDAEFGVLAAGFTEDGCPTDVHHLLLNVGAVQTTSAVQNARLFWSLQSTIADREMACVQTQQARIEAETLNEISRALAYEHDLERLVQIVTDAATKLTNAKFGAFFYNVSNEKGESYMLYTLSGAPREAFEKFPLPRNTPLFEATFRGKRVVRSDDVLRDSLYGRNPPNRGMPKGHLPVRSYLAVPVVLRSGEVAGGLFFGHPDPGQFNENAERMAVGIAAHAAIAIDRSGLLEQHKRTAELNATITNNSTQGLLMMDERGFCTFMNPAAQKMLGFTLDEIRSRPLHEMIHHHHLDGRPFPISECPIDRALPEQQEIRDHEDVFIRKNGEFFPVSVAASPISGKPAGTVIEVRDISERKRTEQALFLAQEQLREHAANLERTVADRTFKLRETVNELQTLSYSIAHDMRAPLRAMASFGHLLLEEVSATGALSDQAKEYSRRILTGAGRLDKLIRDALNYTKIVQQDLPLEPVHLSNLLRDLIDTYPNLHPQKADIRLDGDLPVVFGNESLLTQCFSNLLGNAVKFVAPGVRPCVVIRSELMGKRTRIWVQDNGIGIPKHAQERLFGIFQKLDHEYEGTGIGLAIVRKVVERMGGSVGAESVPSVGSRFWVELNVVQTPPSCENEC